MTTTPKPSTVLETVAHAMAGEGWCCQIYQDGECCMTPRAREMFTAMNQVGGPSLEECEAIARGEVRLVRTVSEAK